MLLALDQGTTSTRAIRFDITLRPLAMAQRDLTQHFPQPGWVEHISNIKMFCFFKDILQPIYF